MTTIQTQQKSSKSSEDKPASDDQVASASADDLQHNASSSSCEITEFSDSLMALMLMAVKSETDNCAGSLVQLVREVCLFITVRGSEAKFVFCLFVCCSVNTITHEPLHLLDNRKNPTEFQGHTSNVKVTKSRFRILCHYEIRPWY